MATNGPRGRTREANRGREGKSRGGGPGREVQKVRVPRGTGEGGEKAGGPTCFAGENRLRREQNRLRRTGDPEQGRENRLRRTGEREQAPENRGERTEQGRENSGERTEQGRENRLRRENRGENRGCLRGEEKGGRKVKGVGLAGERREEF